MASFCRAGAAQPSVRSALGGLVPKRHRPSVVASAPIMARRTNPVMLIGRNAGGYKWVDQASDLDILPPRFLRDSDAANFDPATHQRMDVDFDQRDGRPLQKRRSNGSDPDRYRIADRSYVGDEICIVWGDGARSSYPVGWIREQVARRRGNRLGRVLWSDVPNMTEERVRSPSSEFCLSFRDAVDTDEGAVLALTSLYRYGLLLVTETPVNDGGCGVAALASAITGGSLKDSSSAALVAGYRDGRTTPEKGGATALPDGTDGPLRTLYGSVWSTTAAGQAEGLAQADSAYGCGALPLHTDHTYYQHPAGLQIFTMVQPASDGGESVFADGFAVAERLRSTQPDAFRTLCSVERRYRCIDDGTGWHLEATGPVISATDNGDGTWGDVRMIRHNDLDRLADLPPATMEEKAEVDAFYARLEHAHARWDSLLQRDEFRLILCLQPGDTVIVANQRCLHGRHSFVTSEGHPRAIMGCYTSQDELDSRFRIAGLTL